ncbi:MAG: redox-sensing transcriptional repressor Rex [Oscillospiraceae bacterium]|nr:redox-sensing transcriptional repressor Rex [Oscillospiraceae bacterium]
MTTKKTAISASVIKRLPRYYRFIGELIKQGTVRISSGELAERMSLTASQIRQDLNCFGGFGQQGYGYNLIDLQSEIGKILGVKQGHKTVLIGAGNLGHAIAAHMNFSEYGCDLIGIFDIDKEKIGGKASGLEIMPVSEMESFFARENPKIAILCIPKTAAQELADKLVLLGIKAFWNFSHYDIKISHKDVVVENVHLGDSIMMLSYALTNSEKKPVKAAEK